MVQRYGKSNAKSPDFKWFTRIHDAWGHGMRKEKIMFVHWRILIENPRHSRRGIVWLWVYLDWTLMHSSGGEHAFVRERNRLVSSCFSQISKEPVRWIVKRMPSSSSCFKRGRILFFFWWETLLVMEFYASAWWESVTEEEKLIWLILMCHCELVENRRENDNSQWQMPDFSSLPTLLNNHEENYFSLQSYRCNQQCLRWEAFRSHS